MVALDCCVHRFCVACIVQWTATASCCPLCNSQIHTINRHGPADVLEHIEVAPKVREVPQLTTADLVQMDRVHDCSRCLSGDSTEQNEILLCDSCGGGWHQSCLEPPLAAVDIPPGEWYCPVCARAVERLRLAAEQESAAAEEQERDVVGTVQ